MDFEITTKVLILVFLGAVAIGAIAHKTNFCTMGAVSDWINMGSTGRLGAWFTAIAVAILGLTALKQFLDVSTDSTIPPYATANFAWLRYIVGGFLFGIGMTLAGGCGNKTLVNIGGGSLRSLVVLVVVSIMAYLMTKTKFYEVLFYPWVNATTVNLADFDIKSQSLADIFAGIGGIENSSTLMVVISLLLAALFLFLAFRSKQFRKNKLLMFGGVAIGALIIGAWYVTGGAMGQEAIESVEWLDEPPIGVGVQSYTFINPMGESLVYLMSPANTLLITFGVVSVLGVIVGALVTSLITGTFKITYFANWFEFVKHVIGGVLMGIGGILGMGCTFGQGITGVSTLAIGSILVLVFIIFGSALTIKISYYRMMYDEEATFMASLLSTLVDFKLLPEALRRLEEP